MMQRNSGRRSCWVGWRRWAYVCVCVVWGECWGMGCLYNEVRRGLLLTMEAKGVRSGLNCVRSEDEAAELGDVRRGFVALVRSRYSRGGSEGEKQKSFKKNKNDYFQLAAFYPQRQTGNTRHLQRQHLISCPLYTREAEERSVWSPFLPARSNRFYGKNCSHAGSGIAFIHPAPGYPWLQ